MIRQGDTVRVIKDGRGWFDKSNSLVGQIGVVHAVTPKTATIVISGKRWFKFYQTSLVKVEVAKERVDVDFSE